MHDTRVVPRLVQGELGLLLEESEAQIGAFQQQAVSGREPQNAPTDHDHVVRVSHPSIVPVYRLRR